MRMQTNALADQSSVSLEAWKVSSYNEDMFEEEDSFWLFSVTE